MNITICKTIFKYEINKFNFYVLETFYNDKVYLLFERWKF